MPVGIVLDSCLEENAFIALLYLSGFPRARPRRIALGVGVGVDVGFQSCYRSLLLSLIVGSIVDEEARNGYTGISRRLDVVCG